MSNYDKEFKRMIDTNLSTKPSEVDGIGNRSFWFYRQKLYEKIYSRFEFENFPESWDIDYFRDVLFQEGFLVCTKTSLGIVALRSAYSGYNVYEKPTHATISNPVLGTLERTIGVDCEPIYYEYMSQTYSTMEQLVTRYALLLAQIDGSLNTSLINSRISHVFTAKNKQVINTMRQMYDKVTNGTPVCFALFDKDMEPTLQTWFSNVKSIYIGNDLLQTKRTIINEFCTEIGISNANIDKRERLNSDEVNANNEETMTLIEMWVETLNKCFERCHDMYDEINVRVKLRKEDEHEPVELDTMGRSE